MSARTVHTRDGHDVEAATFVRLTTAAMIDDLDVWESSGDEDARLSAVRHASSLLSELARLVAPLLDGQQPADTAEVRAEAAEPGDQHRRRLCAHADQDGRGMHWLAPGETCPEARLYRLDVEGEARS